LQLRRGPFTIEVCHLIKAHLEALKNMIAQVGLILETAPPLPENRTARCRELLQAVLALSDDLLSEARGSLEKRA